MQACSRSTAYSGRFVAMLAAVLAMLAGGPSAEAVQYQIIYVPVTITVNGKPVVIRRPVVRPVANPGVTVPYSLPAVGTAVTISSNTASQIKPAAITSSNWAYSVFNSYGTGSFNPDFSPAGAFVIAGSGGHNAPPNLDAAVFDFSTGSWKLVNNANGIAARNADYATAEVSNDGYRELLAATAGRVPAPTHLYGYNAYLPASLGGGAKGSFLRIGGGAVTTSGVFGRGIHRMDLTTGLWTRATNDLIDPLWATEGTVVFDPVARRYYFIPDSFHRVNYLQYYDAATATVTTTPSYPYPADYTASGYQTTWLDPVRRLILNERPGFPLRALDLNNIAAGWVVLKTTGTPPTDANRWAFYEPDGRFYTRGNNSGQRLNQLTPPADWKNGTWTYGSVAVSGATLPNYTNTGGNNTRHYGTFFYVPALKSLAWISGESTPVVLLKPPAPASGTATACDTATGRVLEVGPGKTYAVPSAAAAAAVSGDVIRIAAGDYRGDVATWRQDRLTICGIGGRARLFADGRNAGGKAIWVIGGSDVVVDSIEFHDAKVPDQNGAGIRAEGGNLTVRNSGFFDNEDGILSGAGTHSIVIDRCEFARNGFGDGFSHNIYIGAVDRLLVTNSFFHEARVGHNFKSRARETRIENSYFMDGPNGTSSYLADFSNGGIVMLRGNLFHKGPLAENSTAIAYALEGFRWPTNTLEMVHNTVVITRGGGAFLAAPGATQSVRLTANLLAGTGNPALMTGGFPAAGIVQANNVFSAATNVPGADNIASPGFWPNATLLPQLSLTAVPDAGYLSDSPRPMTLRGIVGSTRIVGALQAKP